MADRVNDKMLATQLKVLAEMLNLPIAHGERGASKWEQHPGLQISSAGSNRWYLAWVSPSTGESSIGYSVSKRELYDNLYFANSLLYAGYLRDSAYSIHYKKNPPGNMATNPRGKLSMRQWATQAEADASDARIEARYGEVPMRPRGAFGMPMPTAGLMAAIRVGDRVTIVDRFGKEKSGRAVMPSSDGGWVLNMGGAHGTPGIANENNTVKVRGAKRNPRAKAEDAGVPFPYVCKGRVCAIVGSDVKNGLRYRVRFPDRTEKWVKSKDVTPNWEKNSPRDTPAKKGDLVVARIGRRATYMHGPAEATYDHVPAVVESVNARGMVLKARRANGTLIKTDIDNVSWLVAPAKHLNGHAPTEIVKKLEDYYDTNKEAADAVLAIVNPGAHVRRFK